MVTVECLISLSMVLEVGRSFEEVSGRKNKEEGKKNSEWRGNSFETRVHGKRFLEKYTRVMGKNS